MAASGLALMLATLVGLAAAFERTVYITNCKRARKGEWGSQQLPPLAPVCPLPPCAGTRPSLSRPGALRRGAVPPEGLRLDAYQTRAGGRQNHAGGERARQGRLLVKKRGAAERSQLEGASCCCPPPGMAASYSRHDILCRSTPSPT